MIEIPADLPDVTVGWKPWIVRLQSAGVVGVYQTEWAPRRLFEGGAAARSFLRNHVRALAVAHWDELYGDQPRDRVRFKVERTPYPEDAGILQVTALIVPAGTRIPAV